MFSTTDALLTECFPLQIHCFRNVAYLRCIAYGMFPTADSLLKECLLLQMRDISKVKAGKKLQMGCSAIKVTKESHATIIDKN